MKITAIKPQVKNKSRVSVYVDDAYLFSLDLTQLLDLKVMVGAEYTEEELTSIRNESDFGKLYGRALEYAFIRPRSVGELQQYLYRKTMSRRGKEGTLVPGYSKDVAARVEERILEKGYVDDVKFTTYWVENRKLQNGVSQRLLRQELRSKGVDNTVIDYALSETERTDKDELLKVIEKKAARYTDREKLTKYLVGQGFSYGDVVEVLSTWGD